MDEITQARQVVFLLAAVLDEYETEGTVADDWRDLLEQAITMVYSLFGIRKNTNNGKYHINPVGNAFTQNRVVGLWVFSTIETLEIILDYHTTTSQMIDSWDDRLREVQEIIGHAIRATGIKEPCHE